VQILKIKDDSYNPLPIWQNSSIHNSYDALPHGKLVNP